VGGDLGGVGGDVGGVGGDVGGEVLARWWLLARRWHGVGEMSDGCSWT
jgi:hypothetical protein